MRHGGVQNRPGSIFVCEVKDSSKQTVLIPFIFNSSQTYMLEFGDQYLRVIKSGAQVLDSTKNITGITAANPPVVTSTSHGFSNGDEVYISGVSGMAEINGRNYKIANVAANTFELQDLAGTNIDASAFTAYTSGGTAGRVYTVSTPYVEADLTTLKYAQSGDVIVIAHPNYAPRELSRTGDASWSLSTITFAPSISAPTGESASQSGTTGSTSYNWKITAVKSETYEESLPSGAANITNGNATISSTNFVTVSWSAVTGAVQYNIYQEVNGVYGFIGIADGTSFKVIGQTPDVTDTPPITRNPFNATGDYPSTVNYFQQRLCFANSDNNPETVWLGKAGQYHNFTISAPLQDDDAVTFTIAGRQVNEVHHLLDLGTLLLLTAGGEWTAQGDANGAVSPGSINLKQYGYNGSSEVIPLVIGNN
ncbi:MAG: hypothetical protein KDH96_09070, partial [Candidatus Riesia sp.]|nr:hypothetical protein [Candidatus Riesia sp.]